MLFELQKEIIRNSNPKYLFNLGTGTGKTIIALHHYFKFSKGDNIYIFAPAAKVNEGGWVREIEKVFSYYALPLPQYKVISYNQISKYKYTKGYFIVDECHYIKNSQSQRGKLVREILKKYANNYSLLSATPISVFEDWCNYSLIWELYRNKTDFYKNHIVLERRTLGSYRSFLEVKGYKNTEYFMEKIQNNISKKYTVDDMLDLPGMIYRDVILSVSNDYKKVKKDRVIYTTNEEPILLDTLPKLTSTLRQITNTNKKLEYLDLIVENIKNSGENLVIFYNFKSEATNIYNHLKLKNIEIDYFINGKNKTYLKKEEFENQKGTITLVQIQAGGTGIELQYANQVVFYSPTYSYQDYEQSLGRCYRPGQKHKVVVYKFKVKNSIEIFIYKNLEQKQDFNEKIWSDYD